MSHSAINQTLSELENLLRLTHAYGWANRLDDLIHKLPEDELEVMNYLTGGNIWGSSGSLLDLWLFSVNGHISDDFDRDNRRLSELLLQLLTDLREVGFGRAYFSTSEVFLRGRI